ncbi:MAG: aspartyl/glutamyl-tRNA amidotransferase subunit C [bacterium]|nr:aspartyl/glutamyl-tRNA amidotransferase subunit C [bacterium]
MISDDDMKRLFKLARIEPSEEDLKNFPEEIGSIIDYVGQLKEVEGKGSDTELILSEKDAELRPDKEMIPSSSDADALINEFPEKVGRLLKSKKVFEG